MNDELTSQNFDERAKEALALATAKLVQAGMTVVNGSAATSIHVVGAASGHIQVRAIWNRRGYGHAQIALRVGYDYSRGRHIYTSRNGKGFDWAKLVAEVKRQKQNAITFAEDMAQRTKEDAESKRLMDEIVAANGLPGETNVLRDRAPGATTASRTRDGDVVVRNAEFEHLDVHTRISRPDETRTYTVGLDLHSLSRGQLEQLLFVLRPILVEHKLAEAVES